MTETDNNTKTRWDFVRDVLVFQVKLVADGLRDMVLIPASLVAGVIGLLAFKDTPEEPFHLVLNFGKRSEYWINLFGSLPDELKLQASESVERLGNLDEVVGRMERLLVDQYEKGGITATAKESIDNSINALHEGIDKLSARNEGAESDDQ